MVNTLEIKRKNRLASLLTEAASSFVRFEIDPNAIITITETEISKDLRSVKFFISVFPNEREEEILVGLKKKKFIFKNYLKRKTKINFLPSTYFELDKRWEIKMEIDNMKI